MKYDPEGAMRGHNFILWGQERGIELAPCAAEDHGAIGDVESIIGKVKTDVRTFLRDCPVDAMSGILHVVAAHNTLDRVGGYAPCQWAYGRFPTLDNRLFDDGHAMPVHSFQGTPGTSMRDNMVARVKAEEHYRRSQAAQRISRALNSKPHKQTVFLPGDLVYYKRYKPPAQSLSHAGVDSTGKPSLSRWYGPARILATETKRSETSKYQAFRPGHIVWLTAGGRLKRCSPHQLRHCSERERLLAEAAGGYMTYPWSFTDIIQKVSSGAYDDYDDLEQEFEKGLPGLADASIREKVPRSRSRARSQGRDRGTRTPVQEVERGSTVQQSVETPRDQTTHQVPLSDELEQKRSGFQSPRVQSAPPVSHEPNRPGRNVGDVEMKQEESRPMEGRQDDESRPMEGQQKSKEEKSRPMEGHQKPQKIPRMEVRAAPPKSDHQSSGSKPSKGILGDQPTTGSADLDLRRYLSDPEYQPHQRVEPRHRPDRLASRGVGRDRERSHGISGELLAHPPFQRAVDRMTLKELADSKETFFSDAGDDRAMVSFEIPAPSTARDVKMFTRDATTWMAQAVKKSPEVKLSSLTPEQVKSFDAAKAVEVNNWIREAAVRAAGDHVPTGRIMRMRWVLTYKSSGAAKARIVVVGFEDPDLLNLSTTSPTMSRLTRQLFYTKAAARAWGVLKGDVKSALLQGMSSEEQRNVFAWPLPELAAALGITTATPVQLLKACYGLCNAPAEWHQSVTQAMLEAGFSRMATEPCAWRLMSPDGRVIGLAVAHVDDFLFTGDEEEPLYRNALAYLHEKFTWTPWEEGSI